jgi:hypothetical protein
MAIGDTVQAGLMRIDSSPILLAGQAQAKVGEKMGQTVGGIIEQYSLNKEKRNQLESTLQGQLSADPSIVQQLTMSGDETSDKKNMKLFEDIKSGDASIAQLERANGLLAGRTMQENAMLRKRVDELDFSVKQALKDPTIRKAVGEANRAEAIGNYANSIASAEYAEKIADADLTRAQTEYYGAKSKAEQDSKSYTPGQRVDVEGISGNKVSFVWTGNSLQPLNDSVSKKSIQEAIIRGVDPAVMQVYLEDNYDYDEGTESYTFKGKSNMVGYGGGQKDPMMEQAITILGMRPKVKDEDSAVSKEPTSITEPSIDEHMSANEKAKSSGKMFYTLNGKKYTVQ